MRPLRAALRVETTKALASTVLRATTMILVGGVVLLTSTMTWAAAAGNEQVLAQLGPLADLVGWERYTAISAQITAAGGLLALGVALSWSVGREFADGTMSGLFALPVARRTIVAAKLIVHVAWSVCVAVLLAMALLAVGIASGLGMPDGDATQALARLSVLVVLSSLLVFPVAWAVTVGRSLLVGVAVVVGIVVVCQVVVVAGGDGWMPFAAPALWAMDPADVSPGQLVLVAAVPVVFGVLSLQAWNRLELDR
ncbi:ABC transporter permease [Mumia qirimensis]|uniref:ABC transporter permease n=1 Tax=Mumia qirimensis TaxID=3234852 RepID=UPI00351D8AA1